MVTVAPKTALSQPRFFSSITLDIARLFSNSCILPCRKDCLSLAAEYSAFSDRSPCALAVSMSLIFAGMEIVLRTSSSLFNRAKPALVMGIFSINLLLPEYSSWLAGRQQPGQPTTARGGIISKKTQECQGRNKPALIHILRRCPYLFPGDFSLPAVLY